jgi:glycine cleavage system H protein
MGSAPNPATLRYTKTHEWVRLEGDVCTVGISKFAADQLSDITYIELPHVGDHAFAGEELGNIETVKAVSDLYSPVTGEVTAVNEKVVESPNLLTEDPFGAGWLFKVRLEPGTKLDHLLTAEQYQKQIESEAH